jgi:hypothetical protein
MGVGLDEFADGEAIRGFLGRNGDVLVHRCSLQASRQDGLSIDLSHGSSTFPKFLSIMRQLSPRKAIYKTS